MPRLRDGLRGRDPLLQTHAFNPDGFSAWAGASGPISMLSRCGERSNGPHRRPFNGGMVAPDLMYLKMTFWFQRSPVRDLRGSHTVPGEGVLWCASRKPSKCEAWRRSESRGPHHSSLACDFEVRPDRNSHTSSRRNTDRCPGTRVPPDTGCCGQHVEGQPPWDDDFSPAANVSRTVSKSASMVEETTACRGPASFAIFETSSFFCIGR